MAEAESNTEPNAEPRDPRQPADFDPIALGRHLLRAIRVGALGTLDRETGFPITTLVSVATDLDGAPVILVSGLSHHTKNLFADPRCSVLLSEGGRGDPLAHPRLTLTARAEKIQDNTIRRRFLARHPKAKLYVDFPDFAFYRLVPHRMQLNGGFARAFDGDGALILSDIGDRAAFAALEDSAVAHLNDDHAEALALYARVLCKMGGGNWRATGLDPDGLDLALGERAARISFTPPLRDARSLRLGLKQLADLARNAEAEVSKRAGDVNITE
ncbi:MAG: HugZ family protein [Rhizobiales bacterium]|nr:HugZ family protein [Hyphomicrobiales bacterium]